MQIFSKRRKTVTGAGLEAFLFVVFVFFNLLCKKQTQVHMETNIYGEAQDKLGVFSIISFMAYTSGVSFKEIFETIGITSPGFYHWKTQDDFKISRLQQVANICGYSLRVGLCRDEPIKSLIKEVDTNRPLRFITESLYYYGLTMEKAAKMAGINQYTFNGWILGERCKIRDIMDFAAKMGMKLYVVLERKESFRGKYDEESNPKSIMHVSAISETDWDFTEEDRPSYIKP